MDRYRIRTRFKLKHEIIQSFKFISGIFELMI